MGENFIGKKWTIFLITSIFSNESFSLQKLSNVLLIPPDNSCTRNVSFLN